MASVAGREFHARAEEQAAAAQSEEAELAEAGELPGVPAQVAVFDYNYRAPGTDLFVKHEVDKKRGFGGEFYWGEHFKDNDQGAAIAKVRAERRLTERVTFRGVTDCARFRVGHSFELDSQHR